MERVLLALAPQFTFPFELILNLSKIKVEVDRASILWE